MIKEFMLVFALMLFILASYHVIQFAHGKSTTRTGVVAIISLVGSLSYPWYYFSSHNVERREQILNVFAPVSHMIDRILDMTMRVQNTDRRVRALANDASTVADDLVQRSIGAVGTGVFAYATATLVAVGTAPVVPSISAILFGPVGWLILPLLGALFGIGRIIDRGPLGGKRLKNSV
jgi:hypothetical protein